MPGNWDQIQYINATTGRVEWPTGPVTVDGTPKFLEAWVLQRSTGASQRTVQTVFDVPGRWTAGAGASLQGRFQEGSALGIALVASQDGATNEFYWWIDELDLEFLKA